MKPRKLAERCQKNLITERFGGDFALRLRPLTEAASLPKGAIGVAELTAGQSDIVNRNNRFYPMSAYSKATERAQPLIGKKQFFGEVDHPDWEGTLSKTAAYYTELKLDGDLLVGTVAILDNDNGRQLLSLLNADIPVEVSTRGYATSEEGEKILPDGSAITCRIINDDLWFEGIDFVMHASNPAGKVTSHHESLEDTPMDLTALKAAHPDLVALIAAESRVGYVPEADVVARETAATEAAGNTPAAQAAEANAKIVAAIFEALKAVLPADASAAAALATKASTLESQLATVTAERDALVNEKTTQATSVAEAAAKVALAAHIVTVLKDCEFADDVKPALEACSTIEEVTTKFAEATAMAVKIKARLGVKPTDDKGTGVADVTDPTNQENASLASRNAERVAAGLEPLK